MIKKLLPLLAILYGSAVIPASAQPVPGAPQPMKLSVHSGTVLSSNEFTQTWSPRPGLHLNLRVPYHRIYLELGSRYMRFEGEAPTETDSDFHSILFYLGAAYPVAVTERFSISPAVRFGNNLMIFDEPEVFEKGSFRFKTDPAEMEFSYELALRNEFMITDRWSVHAALSYNRTLTNFAIPLTMISAGVSYAFPEPRWLKNFLQ